MSDFGVYYAKEDYAGFCKRVIIAVVDLIILLLVTAIIIYLSDYIISDEGTYLKFNFLFFILISFLYLGLLKRSKYGTIGFVVTGVKIVDLKGHKPSVFKMLLRVALLALGPFELIVDIIWLTSEATKQTLRDKYVGTYVIDKNANPVGESPIKSATLGIMGWNLMYREIQGENIK